MTDKYQISLKALRSVTGKIDESLPSPTIVTTDGPISETTMPPPGSTQDLNNMLPTLQGHVAGFNRRIQSSHALVTQVGPIELGDITPHDETLQLLPKDDSRPDIVFDRRSSSFFTAVFVDL